MGSENRAYMVAQMNDSDQEQLFSQSRDGSNISKNSKKNKIRVPMKRNGSFFTRHGATVPHKMP